MNTIIISNEHLFLHISNDDEHIDYSFYNHQGKLIDGGVLDGNFNKNQIDEAAKKIIDSYSDLFVFSKPYTKLEGTRADNFLEILEESEYNNTQEKLKQYFSNDKDLDIEKDI